MSLVGSHEDQLAAITSLCKQEMKLLLNAKKAVPRACIKTITIHSFAYLEDFFLFFLLNTGSHTQACQKLERCDFLRHYV